MPTRSFPLSVAPLIAAAALCAQLRATSSNNELGKTLAKLAKLCNHPQQYSWQGDLTIDAREGNSGNFLPVTSAKVELALGPDGKSLLKLAPQNGQEYWLISDGKRTWSYLPAKKQYMVAESARLSADAGDAEENAQEDESDDDQSGGTLAERYARSAVSTVADVLKRSEQIGSSKSASLKFQKEKVNWPVVQIVAKPDEHGVQTIAELVMSPDAPVIARLAWIEVHPKSGKTITVRTNLQFSSFSIGDPVPEELFTFDPPKKAWQVEDLDIPGQPGSALVNHTSPDFEERTISGEKVRLSDLRGKVVMLNFWATWCPPCRAELPTVAKLYAELKDKGLVVYGVNDEDRSTARQYLEKVGLDLPTIDDSSQKASRLYRVTSIPTVFLIDQDGKVVKWLNGGHSEESLRAALKSAGVGN